MMYPKKYFRFLTKRNAVVAFIALASAFWICGIATALMVGGDTQPSAQLAQAGITQIVITQNLAAPTYTPYPTYTAPAQPQAQTILLAATSPPAPPPRLKHRPPPAPHPPRPISPNSTSSKATAKAPPTCSVFPPGSSASSGNISARAISHFRSSVWITKPKRCSKMPLDPPAANTS